MVIHIATATIVLALSATASAAWSTAHVPLADRSGEQAQPKLVPTADGGMYLSWFDNSTGGYDVYLQRLDAEGNELWAHNGVLVADRGFSSTQDYGLAIDTSGNALLAFRDDRFGGTQITAAKVRPDGTLLWGVNGVQLTSDNAFHAAPGIAGTTDGGIVVAWTNDSDLKLQRLDSAGNPQWGAGVVRTDGAGGQYSFSDIHEGDGGSVIASWNRQQNFSGAKHIYCQKFDAVGAAQWNGGSPVIVFDGGSLQFGNFPDFVTDGNGGAVFGWYSNSPLTSYAQHILADGSEDFPHNGMLGSTSASQNHVSPDVAYNAASGETFLFWTETNSTQSMQGIYGQRFAPGGARLWPNTGLVIAGLGSATTDFVNVTLNGGGAVVSYLEGSGSSDRVKAVIVDATGTSNSQVISDVISGKSRPTAVNDAAGGTVFVWQDTRTDVNDIYGQNMNADGSLGAAPCDADTNGDNTVDVDDLVAVILAWGSADPDADIDGSGIVDVDDLVQVILNWGDC